MRPIVHGVLINLVFLVVYKLRLFTDLIPGIQLPIPIINPTELLTFSLLASGIFVFIGIIKKFYTLDKPISQYFKTFLKTWIYWFISITFISYFGQGFIFMF